MNIKLNEIKNIFSYIKKITQNNIDKKKWDEALSNIEVAAKIANNFNWIYSDEELENFLEEISRNILIEIKFQPNSDKIIFYDSWGLVNRGLTLQYLRAFQKAKFQILYIFENEDITNSLEIRNEFENEKNFQIKRLENNNKIDRIKELSKYVSEFKPEKVFLHITPWAVEALTVFYACKNIITYQINLTDHAFWLGAKCLDYCIEFRDYGCNISIEKRNIKKEQIIVNPYYPVIINRKFKELPKKNPEKIYILSGGSYYKIYGENDVFFKITLKLLYDFPEIIIFFAGGGDGRILRKFILSHSLTNRFILLGTRPDIGKVFDICDIYLSTYPVSGGLMAQIAALYAKPIIAYTTEDLKLNFIENLINVENKIRITHTCKKSFYKEITKLINDSDYRMIYGEILKKSLLTSEQFNENLLKILTSKRSSVKFNHIKINYSAITKLYLEVENNYQDQFKRLFLKYFGIRAFASFPITTLKCLPALFRVIMYKNLITK